MSRSSEEDSSSEESTSSGSPPVEAPKATPPPSPVKIAVVGAPSPFAQGANHPALRVPLVEQIRQRFERPMSGLQIHTDFLRFFPGTSLSEDGQVLWSKFRDTPKYHEHSKEYGMREYFSLLAERDTDDPLLASWVKRKFFEYIPEGKSAEGAQTPIHFQRLLRDVIPETSAIAGVLKCINQAIAAPAAMILRLKLMPRGLNFKDGRFWDCDVHFFDEKVLVTHSKCEESFPKAIEFIWSMEMELTRDGKEMTRAELRIASIKFVNPAAEQMKDKYRKMFEDLITPKTVELTA